MRYTLEVKSVETNCGRKIVIMGPFTDGSRPYSKGLEKRIDFDLHVEFHVGDQVAFDYTDGLGLSWKRVD